MVMPQNQVISLYLSGRIRLLRITRALRLNKWYWFPVKNGIKSRNSYYHAKNSLTANEKSQAPRSLTFLSLFCPKRQS